MFHGNYVLVEMIGLSLRDKTETSPDYVEKILSSGSVGVCKYVKMGRN